MLQRIFWPALFAHYILLHSVYLSVSESIYPSRPLPPFYLIEQR